MLSGVLVAFKLEADSDYHLVIADGDRTMIVEIPLPSCVSPGPDPMQGAIATARQARYHPGPSIQQVIVPVTVTGVGFFDSCTASTASHPRHRAAPSPQHHLQLENW